MSALPRARAGASRDGVRGLNLLLVAPEELDGGRAVTLEGRRARHLIEVLRVAPGTELRAGVIDGRSGTARVEEVADARVRLELEVQPEPPPPPVELVLAVPRPKVLSRVLETAASLGVRRIDLVNAWRVEKSYLDSPRLAPERLREAVWLGCEQGGQPRLPEVHLHRRLMLFVDDVLPSLERGTDVLAHPRAAQPVEALAPLGEEVVRVAVGPEGGWKDREVETWERLGFNAVRLSDAVLRVEAAVAAGLGQLELLRRWDTPSPGRRMSE